MSKSPSPYKLHVHRQMSHIPINWLGLQFVQQVAVLTDPLFDLMQAVRDRRVDAFMPRLPDTDDWLELYRDHNRLTRSIGNALPGLWGMDGDGIVELLGETRAISRYERANPGAISGEIIRSLTPMKFRQWFRIVLKQCHRDYKAHLIKLRQELQAGYGMGDDDLGVKMADEPALYFYVRVILPALLLWQTTPQRLFRLVRSATSESKRLEAVERLIRLDPLSMHLGEIREWVNVPDGVIRNEREQMMLRWRQQGLEHGKFDRSKFKAVMGALIQSIAERMGR